MPLKERLMDLEGAIGKAASCAPDAYPEHVLEVLGYSMSEMHAYKMADIKELWSEIRPQLKRDIDKVAVIDEKLKTAFAAFEAGNKESGQNAMWAIYNLHPEK